MLEGMTGFSQVQYSIAGIRMAIDLRSYNHRYLDIVINAPNGFGIFEDKMRVIIKNNFARGRLTLNLHALNLLDAEVAVNEKLIKEYLDNVNKISKKFGIVSDLLAKDIINLPGVLNVEKKIVSYKKYWPGLEQLLYKAIKQLKTARILEGKSTLKDILLRAKNIVQQKGFINAAANQIIADKKKELSQEEFSSYLKTTDIAEELSRLSAHLKNFKALLVKSNAAAKGKELDFIAQELQREANTIAAKCQAYKIAESVVKVKAEIEKIREQLQNVQ